MAFYFLNKTVAGTENSSLYSRMGGMSRLPAAGATLHLVRAVTLAALAALSAVRSAPPWGLALAPAYAEQ
jgi:hypothetical protein